MLQYARWPSPRWLACWFSFCAEVRPRSMPCGPQWSPACLRCLSCARSSPPRTYTWSSVRRQSQRSPSPPLSWRTPRGAGTMPETPLVGCLLCGAGLFLIGLSATPRYRSLAWWAAALCFAAATSFHMVAWMVLGPILVVLLVYAWISQRQGGAFRLTTWTWFAAVSVSYCVVWLIGCWVKFGSPFDAIERNAHSLIRDSGITLLSARLSAYPRALLHNLWPLLPLVLFGTVWGSVRTGPDRGRVRTVLTTIGLGLGVAPAVAKSPWLAKYVPLVISMRSTVSGMMKFVSENPWPWACDTILIGMPSIDRATSVPWSASKPRRKY